jgi:iron complex outermembrane receptor protein
MGLFWEWVYPLTNRFIVNGGLRTDFQKEWGFEFNPTVSMKYLIASHFRWRCSTGRIFRTPSFTELYYDSPANVGDPNLKPEHGWSVETGIAWEDREHRLEMTLFWRDEINKIEWIAREMGDPWRVVNIGRTQLSGISVSYHWIFRTGLTIRCYYTGMVKLKNVKRDYFSKYIETGLKHHLMTTLYINYPLDIKESIVLNLKQRENEPFYLLLDSKWSYQWKRYTFFFEMTNILNIDYADIPGVPMPGRCVMIGSSFDYN